MRGVLGAGNPVDPLAFGADELDRRAVRDLETGGAGWWLSRTAGRPLIAVLRRVVIRAVAWLR